MIGSNKFNTLQKKDYSDIRNEIITCDFLFASGNYPISKMIEQFTHSALSHVAIIVKWNERVLLMESVESFGVRIIPLSQYIDNYNNSGHVYDGRLFIARFEPQIDDIGKTKIITKGMDLLGRKYNAQEITEILERLTLKIGYHEDNNAYICSEFVDICYQADDIVFNRDPSGYIYPEHIAADPRVNALWEIV